MTSCMPRITSWPALLTPRELLNAALGAAAPLTAPRGEALQGQGLSLQAFEAWGGEGLPCAPDLGGQAQPPYLPPWEESQGTMGRGALAPTPASWHSGEGGGVGACPPHSKRKVLQESWWWLGSPHGGPRCQGYGRERKTGVIAALCPGLKLSRGLPERVLQAPPQFQEPPQVHPDLRVGKGTNQHVSAIPPKPGWSGSPGADYLH